MNPDLIQAAIIALIVAGVFIVVIALLAMLGNDRDPPQNDI